MDLLKEHSRNKDREYRNDSESVKPFASDDESDTVLHNAVYGQKTDAFEGLVDKGVKSGKVAQNLKFAQNLVSVVFFIINTLLW